SATSSTLTATSPGGATLTFAIASGPTNGMLSSFNAATGAFTYTPNADYHGPDSFTFTASNDTNTSVAATVTITVVDTSTPVANAQAISTNETTAISATLTATDADGDTPSFAIASGPTHGILTSFDPTTGSFTYTPNAN